VEGILDKLFKSMEGWLYRNEGDLLTIDIAALKSEGNQQYWLYRILDEKGFNASQLEDILNAMDGQSGKTFNSATHELIVDRGVLKVYLSGSLPAGNIQISGEGVYTFGDLSFELKIYPKGECFNPVAERGRLYFSADEVVFPMICRGWRSGDRFKPFGMKGFKKLSDLFTDLKMDKRAKESQPVLVNGEDIVCLPGLRSDERYKIKTSTTMVAEVNIL
jgi:tRNA(Ile)-lysidine synthase